MLDPFVIIFDVETTDLQLGMPHLVEIGALKLDSELKVVDEHQTLIRPENMELFSEFSYQLTGIDVDDLENAPPWKDCWKAWAEFTNYKRTRLMSWGSFDSFLLRLEYNRLRLSYPHSDLTICLASMAYMHALTRGWKPKGFSLKNICREFGVTYSHGHRAIVDAKLAASVLREMVQTQEPDKFQLYEV